MQDDISYILSLQADENSTKTLQEFRSEVNERRGDLGEKKPITFTSREGKILSLLDVESSDEEEEEFFPAQGDDEEGLEEKRESGAPLKTEHEQESQIMSFADIDSVSQSQAIIYLGKILSIVEGTVVVQAALPAAQVFDEGTLCCFENRKVLGYIAETFGSVDAPFYAFNFGSTSQVPEDVIMGAQVFCSAGDTHRVDPETLRRFKGTDASNPFDEEADQVEFSDDEEEREYKRQLKNKKKGVNVSDVIGTQPPPGSVGRRMYGQGSHDADVDDEFEFSDGEGESLNYGDAQTAQRPSRDPQLDNNTIEEMQARMNVMMQQMQQMQQVQQMQQAPMMPYPMPYMPYGYGGAFGAPRGRGRGRGR